MVLLRDEKILSFCNHNRILLPISWRHSCNAVRYHDKRESDGHWFFKQAIAYELMKRDQTIFTELKLCSRHEQPVADLFWLDEKIVVEFESEYSEDKAKRKMQQFYLYNTFVFDIKKVTVDDVKKKLGLI